MAIKKGKQKISVKDLDLQTPIRQFLKAMGEDVDREGLKKTPKRFEESVRYLLSGYDRDFAEESTSFVNKMKYRDIISLKNINFFSLCEHHLLPFYGYAHIGYIPSEESYLGISKLARAVDIYSKRLQTQEVLAAEIADAIMTHGKAKGVAVFIEARHLCNNARGVAKKSAVMSTCSYYGEFKDNTHLQQQFMELMRMRKKA
jgi:GTP cyclohydrolase I